MNGVLFIAGIQIVFDVGVAKLVDAVSGKLIYCYCIALISLLIRLV